MFCDILKITIASRSRPKRYLKEKKTKIYYLLHKAGNNFQNWNLYDNFVWNRLKHNSKPDHTRLSCAGELISNNFNLKISMIPGT